jgi:hypothetical protein
MAKSKRITKKNVTEPTLNNLYSILRIMNPEPLEAMLTRSQRLRLGDLVAATGVGAETWVRKAMDNFLNDEAGPRIQAAR